MFYHIIKQSRLYDGRGYSGPTCEIANVQPGQTYTDIGEAIRDAEKLYHYNPVGFKIVQVKVLNDEDGLEYSKEVYVTSRDLSKDSNE